MVRALLGKALSHAVGAHKAAAPRSQLLHRDRSARAALEKRSRTQRAQTTMADRDDLDAGIHGVPDVGIGNANASDHHAYVFFRGHTCRRLQRRGVIYRCDSDTKLRLGREGIGHRSSNLCPKVGHSYA